MNREIIRVSSARLMREHLKINMKCTLMGRSLSSLKTIIGLPMVVLYCGINTQEAEARGLLWIRRHIGLHREYQVSRAGQQEPVSNNSNEKTTKMVKKREIHKKREQRDYPHHLCAYYIFSCLYSAIAN